MITFSGVISYPIPPYSNPPIEPQFYEPSRFQISDITRGSTTTVTTTADHNYVIGQEVRLLIPSLYGMSQINNQKGIVLSIPSVTQVVLNIDSSLYNAYVSNPLTATITAATRNNPAVLTTVNSFRIGNYVTISGVSGMTELNGNTYQITTGTATSITLNVNSIGFGTYTSGGTATLVTTQTNVPQIIAIGDINTGSLNATGRIMQGTYIPGSFIDISPL